MSNKKTSVPSKVKNIAEKFKMIGKVKIEEGFDKSHWKILVACSGSMNVSDLFIMMLQNGIHRFTAVAYGRIQLYINLK